MANPINLGIIPPGALNKLSANTDYIRPSTYQSDVLEVANNLIDKNSYPDRLSGMGPYRAIVVRVDVIGEPEPPFGFSILTTKNVFPKTAIRAWIPELFSGLPRISEAEMAKNKENETKDHKSEEPGTADFYPIFIAKDLTVSAQPVAVGDAVWVDFENKSTSSGGVFLGVINAVYSSAVAGSGSAASGSADGDSGEMTPEKRAELLARIDKYSSGGAASTVQSGKLFNDNISTKDLDKTWYKIKTKLVKIANFIVGEEKNNKPGVYQQDIRVMAYIKNAISTLGGDERIKMAVRAVSYYTYHIQAKHVSTYIDKKGKEIQGWNYDCVGTFARNYYQTKYVLGQLNTAINLSWVNSPNAKVKDGVKNNQIGGTTLNGVPWQQDTKLNAKPLLQGFSSRGAVDPLSGKLGVQVHWSNPGMTNYGEKNGAIGEGKAPQILASNFGSLKPGDGLYQVRVNDNKKGHMRTVLDNDPINKLLVTMEGRTGLTPVVFVYYYGTDDAAFRALKKKGSEGKGISSGLEYISIEGSPGKESKSMLRSWEAHHAFQRTSKNPFTSAIYIVPFI